VREEVERTITTLSWRNEGKLSPEKTRGKLKRLGKENSIPKGNGPLGKGEGKNQKRLWTFNAHGWTREEEGENPVCYLGSRKRHDNRPADHVLIGALVIAILLIAEKRKLDWKGWDSTKLHWERPVPLNNCHGHKGTKKEKK